MQLKHSRDIAWADLPRIESPFFARAHVERAFYADPYGMDAVAGIDEIILDGLPGHFRPRRDPQALDWLLRRVEDGSVVLVHGPGRRAFKPVLRWEDDARTPQDRQGRTTAVQALMALRATSAEAESARAAKAPDWRPGLPQRSAGGSKDASQASDAGRWIADPDLPSTIRLPVERWLTRGRGDGALNRGVPEVSWWDWLVGGAKEAANRFLGAQAAARAEWMAEKGIVQYKDRATGKTLTSDAVYDRHLAEGGKLLRPANTGEAQGAQAVANHAATAAVIAGVTGLASRGKSIARNPDRFLDDLAKALKNSRSESEALGKAGMEQAKDRLGHTTDPRYTDRYHGPDDMTRDKNGKLCEWECKGNKDDSTAVATDTLGNKQGSRAKNLSRATAMVERKSQKIGLPSNRQGGEYTQGEIDLWKEVEERRGNKGHISSHTNTETGEVRVYERDRDGNIAQKLDEFALDDFGELKQRIGKEMAK